MYIIVHWHVVVRRVMGVYGENMDKRYQRVTLVLEPTIVATWEQHVQFASRSFLLHITSQIQTLFH